MKGIDHHPLFHQQQVPPGPLCLLGVKLPSIETQLIQRCPVALYLLLILAADGIVVLPFRPPTRGQGKDATSP